MNRIYLKKRNNSSYWIKDRIDNKKIGRIKLKNNKVKFKLKAKYRNKLIENESLALLKPDKYPDFKKFYQLNIGVFINNIIELENYDYPLFLECCRLKEAGNDMFDRPTLLHPTAKKAWTKMKHAAKSDTINLQIISAFRSLDYQKQLIDNKLAKAQKIDDILKVNTLPGYSEHHTGCAIDIGSTGQAVLEQSFENSAAFTWLTNNAHKYNFSMTYAKNNTTGICYEPWHWCYHNECKAL